MSMRMTPHVNFNGEARAALEFYQSIFGGQLMIATYQDIHSVEAPSQASHVAFGQVKTSNGLDIMAYDVQPSKSFARGTNSFYITISGTTDDEVRTYWDGLSKSANATLVPLGPAPFARLYGMLTDRFGVTWIIGTRDEPSA